MLILEHC